MSDAPTPAASGGKKKFLVIALAALLGASGAGAGVWYFMGRAPASAEVKKKEAKPLFLTLEPFTVNLQDPRGERFAQIGLTLQYEDPKLEMEIKDRLPAVRNDILMLISSKQVEELLTTEGKQQLAEEIRARSAKSLGVETAAGAPDGKAAAEANPIRGVLFSQFIVQ